MSAARDSFLARESDLQGEIRGLQSALEDKEVEIRKLTWAAQDTEKEKQATVEKYGPIQT